MGHRSKVVGHRQVQGERLKVLSHRSWVTGRYKGKGTRGKVQGERYKGKGGRVKVVSRES